MEIKLTHLQIVERTSITTVLLYCFTLVDKGLFGNDNDNGALANSSIGNAGCPHSPHPYYLVGDEIFPLKSRLIKPFPGKLTKK